MYRNRFPTVRSRYGVFVFGNLVAHGDDITDAKVYHVANTGSELVDMWTGKSVSEVKKENDKVSFDELIKIAASGEYEGEKIFEDGPLTAVSPQIKAVEAIDAEFRELEDAANDSLKVDINDDVLDETFDNDIVTQTEQITIKPLIEVEPEVLAPEAPVEALVAAEAVKRKRGRPQKYDFSEMAIGDHIVYDGPIQNARVHASLAKASLSTKELQKRFIAKAFEQAVHIYRVEPKAF